MDELRLPLREERTRLAEEDSIDSGKDEEVSEGGDSWVMVVSGFMAFPNCY